MPLHPDLAPQDRPAFPAEAVDWLVGTEPSAVLTIGDDQLATAVAEAGHRVTALPSPDLAALLPEAAYDSVVVVGELGLDLEALADRLRPGGFLGVVRLERDHRVPWARRLDHLLGNVPGDDQLIRLIECPRFVTIEPAAFRYWQPVDAATFEAMIQREASDEATRAAARELHATHARDRHGLLMPWLSSCHRASVLERIYAVPDEAVEEPASDGDAGDLGAAGDRPARPDGLVLIDLS